MSIIAILLMPTIIIFSSDMALPVDNEQIELQVDASTKSPSQCTEVVVEYNIGDVSRKVESDFCTAKQKTTKNIKLLKAKSQ